MSTPLSPSSLRLFRDGPTLFLVVYSPIPESVFDLFVFDLFVFEVPLCPVISHRPTLHLVTGKTYSPTSTCSWEIGPLTLTDPSPTFPFSDSVTRLCWGGPPTRHCPRLLTRPRFPFVLGSPYEILYECTTLYVSLPLTTTPPSPLVSTSFLKELFHLPCHTPRVHLLPNLCVL